jgi:hypothetical protein
MGHIPPVGAWRLQYLSVLGHVVEDDQGPPPLVPPVLAQRATRVRRLHVQSRTAIVVRRY